MPLWLIPIIIVGIILYFLFVAFVIVKRKRHRKGIQGESITKKYIGETEIGKKYVINNYLVKLDNGDSTQIDHIVILPTGIFVIETKDYSGEIRGSIDNKNWVQTIHTLKYGKYPKTVNSMFLNPILQNDIHIHHLTKILKSKYYFKNIVLFTNRSIINKYESENVFVDYIDQVWTIINRFKNVVLSKNEMEKIYNTLTQFQMENQISEQEHIDKIHTKKINISDDICPLCGKQLILRRGEYGEFYGCSGYPRCKFKKKQL